MSFETLNNAFIEICVFVLPFFFCLFELILFIPSFLPSLFFFVSFFLAKKNRYCAFGVVVVKRREKYKRGDLETLVVQE